ncbi:MAG: biopolymer transporter ExbD [Bradymonadales bacterium]|nr:biopolymer transporter ExbD [Bradymonadales bacterium]
MNFTSPRRPQKGSNGLFDTTALVDVVFILLIFFLITTTVAQSQEATVTINLPQGPAESQEPQQEELTILVDGQGAFYLSPSEGQPGHPIDYQGLENELRVMHETNPEVTIFLRGDRQASYGRIMDVFLLAKAIGFQRVQVVVREEATEGQEP